MTGSKRDSLLRASTVLLTMTLLFMSVPLYVPTAAATQPLNVSVQNILPMSAVISFTTTVSEVAQVNYEVSPKAGGWDFAAGPDGGTELHSFVLSGLSPGTTYDFSITTGLVEYADGDADGSWLTGQASSAWTSYWSFTTPAADPPGSYVVYGSVTDVSGNPANGALVKITIGGATYEGYTSAGDFSVNTLGATGAAEIEIDGGVLGYNLTSPVIITGAGLPEYIGAYQLTGYPYPATIVCGPAASTVPGDGELVTQVMVYVNDSWGNPITGLSVPGGLTLTYPITSGNGAWGPLYEAGNGGIYVMNYTSGNVSGGQDQARVDAVDDSPGAGVVAGMTTMTLSDGYAVEVAPPPTVSLPADGGATSQAVDVWVNYTSNGTGKTGLTDADFNVVQAPWTGGGALSADLLTEQGGGRYNVTYYTGGTPWGLDNLTVELVDYGISDNTSFHLVVEYDELRIVYVASGMAINHTIQVNSTTDSARMIKAEGWNSTANVYVNDVAVNWSSSDPGAAIVAPAAGLYANVSFVANGWTNITAIDGTGRDAAQSGSEAWEVSTALASAVPPPSYMVFGTVDSGAGTLVYAGINGGPDRICTLTSGNSWSLKPTPWGRRARRAWEPSTSTPRPSAPRRTSRTGSTSPMFTTPASP